MNIACPVARRAGGTASPSQVRAEAQNTAKLRPCSSCTRQQGRAPTAAPRAPAVSSQRRAVPAAISSQQRLEPEAAGQAGEEGEGRHLGRHADEEGGARWCWPRSPRSVARMPKKPFWGASAAQCRKPSTRMKRKRGARSRARTWLELRRRAARLAPQPQGGERRPARSRRR